jgi:hypothetical protein
MQIPAYEMGWAELTNGELLAVAESVGFDLLITTDTNDWTRIRRFKERVVLAVSSIRSGAYVEIELPPE